MTLDAFSQTAAQLCFTLLGLWWIVLQTKYAEWIGHRGLRRMATHISLYFLLPGAMSLMALASHARILWATAFVIASLFGAIETVYALRSFSTRARPRRWYAYVPMGSGLIFYLLILLVALLPGIPASLGTTPLTVEAVLLTLLVVLGAALAWRYFAEQPRAEVKE